MKGLTLEQVRKIGRFAWHEDSLLFTPSRGFLVLRIEPNVSLGSCPECGNSIDVSCPIHDCTPINWQDNFYPKDGWNHLAGCDCEFCKAA